MSTKNSHWSLSPLSRTLEAEEPQAFWINPASLSTNYFSPVDLQKVQLTCPALTSDTVPVAKIDPMVTLVAYLKMV